MYVLGVRLTPIHQQLKLYGLTEFGLKLDTEGNMDEKWFACKKFNIPNGRYELLSICEAESGLQIIFCDTKRHVKVFYPTQFFDRGELRV